MRPLLLLPLFACADASLEPYASCNSDVEADPDAALTVLAPELLVPNVDLGVAWYRDAAGFTVLYNAAEEESCFAELALEGGSVLLSHRAGPFDPPDDAIELRWIVSDVDAVYDRLMGTDAELVRDLGDATYGLREFVVRDPYGFRLRFATPL